MTDDASSRWPAALGVALFGAIILLIGWDLVEDYESGADRLHLATELLVLLLAATGIALLWQRYLVSRRAARLLERDLETARGEAERWREESRELLQGLGAAIEQQFERWKLTPAEAGVALLLLKGLSHKEIAGVRGTGERTARQQARAVYLKAGLSGRAELSAFFLEDLLLPRDAPAGSGARDPQ